MKNIFFICWLCCSLTAGAQSLTKMPDSVRRAVDEYNGVGLKPKPAATEVIKLTDDQIKEKLVALALKNNAEVTEADANIEIAAIASKKANSGYLSSVSLGANVNEFVINNSPAANFFPKYNMGVSIPLDIFAKTKAEKKTANQLIAIGNAQKQTVLLNIRTNVLTLYENYKEKKEVLQLQKIGMEDDIAAYERAQQDYAESIITIDELNKIYKSSISEKSILAAKQKEYNVAVIELEAAIGTSLSKVIN